MKKLIEHICPVMFMAGSGGRFLGAFLGQARDNIVQPMKFGPYGDCHNYKEIYSDGFSQYGFRENPLKVLKELLATYNTDNYINSNKCYYPSCHLHSDVLPAARFSKSIKIIIPIHHIATIIQLFAIKKDRLRLGGKTITEDVNLHMMINRFPQIHHFTKPGEYSNIINVNFEDMMFGNPLSFINNLSELTKIPAKQFNLENLVNWRKLSLTAMPVTGPLSKLV